MQLTGSVPAAVMPMRPDLSIDSDDCARHIADLGSVGGVSAVVVNGHAGEITSLTAEERRLSIDIATANTDRPVIAGVYAQGSAEAAAVAREAAQNGADGLLVFPLPALALGGSQQMGYEHIAAVARAVDVPLVVFSYPTSTGMAYDVGTLTRLCDLDEVVAVKDWSLDIARHEQTLAIVRAAQGNGGRVSMLTSFSTNLLPALAVGADGILSGHGSVVAELHVQLQAQVSAGRLDEARQTYRRLQLLTSVVYAAPMANMYARMKEHLVMQGRLRSPAVRPPLHAVDEVERTALREALAGAGLLDVDGNHGTARD